MGFIVNPVAGLGGAVALRGSDGASLQREALRRGAQPRAQDRCAAFLQHLVDSSPAAVQQVTWMTWAGAMGADIFAEPGAAAWQVEVCGAADAQSTGTDTQHAAAALLQAGMDCLVFTGGDGTARDVLAAVGDKVPVLGIPAGVKMHSGVFAVSPRTAAMLLALLIDGGIVARALREVRDYDEERSSDREIQVRTYGEMCVPEVGGYLQQTKVGGRESEPLAVAEICAGVVEELPDGRPVVLGPGSTCLAVKQALGISGTLRGCDVRLSDGQILLDASADQLEALIQPVLVVSFTRAQGFLFGRGNQQLSARFLRSLHWPEDVRVIATRTKLLSLEQRPLLLDTSDDALDARMSGLVQVITGYEDSLLYRVAREAC